MLKDVKNQHLSLEVSIIFLYLCSERDKKQCLTRRQKKGVELRWHH